MASMANETELLTRYDDYPLVNLRTCFYLLLPQETYFKTLQETPNLAARAVQAGFFVVFLELIILLATGRGKEWRIHSSIVSWTSTAMYEGFSLFLFRGLELTLYQWTFDNYRLFTFPWNAFYTYLFALLTVEFCGYWWHRMGHELAIMWAAHELHHSADDFNLSVGFRNCSMMRFFRWTFYIPLAFLGVPASIMFAHLTLGSIYNGAIHQHAVPKLGKVIPYLGDFIELIFVTPSHHRVHHASNRYCIDKNYGQYIIVWDRLFGTFVEEKEDEPLVFGTLTQPNSYNMAKLQVSSFAKLWSKFQSMNTLGDKLRTLFYGPGWFPGTPRLGIYEDIPDVRGRKKYDPSYPLYMSVYLVVNSFCIFYSYIDMAGRVSVVSEWIQFLNIVSIFFGYTAIGGLYDKQKYSPVLELLRTVAFLGMYHTLPMLSTSHLSTFVIYTHYVNLLVWPVIARYIYGIKENEKDTLIDYNAPTRSKNSVKQLSNGKVENRNIGKRNSKK